MKEHLNILAVAAIGCVTITSSASTLFEDDFANGIVSDSTSVPGFWTLGLNSGAGDANAVAESGGTVTMTAGSNDGVNDGIYSGSVIYSATSSNHNFFTAIRKFSVRGISFDDHGSGIPNASEKLRFCLISGGTSSYNADDALVVKTTPDGKIRLGRKENDPNNNSEGTLIYEFSGLGVSGTYGFDLTVGPITGTSQEYMIEVYTGAVPVSAGVEVGILNLSQANWGDGSGDSKLLFWTQESNVNGGNQYFDATVTNMLVQVVQAEDNILSNAGFEIGTTTGWTRFSEPPGGPTLSIVTSPVHTGTYACLVTNRTQTYFSVARDVSGIMETGEVYTVSLWARLGSGGPETARLSMKIKDGAGETYPNYAVTQLVSTAWTKLEGQVSFEYTAPLTTATLYIAGPATGLALFVDDASITKYVEPPLQGTMFIFE